MRLQGCHSEPARPQRPRQAGASVSLRHTPEAAAQKCIQAVRQGAALALSEGEIGEIEQEHLIEGLAAWAAARAGFLYLAASPNGPNLYKIGRTRVSIAARMQSLNNAAVLAHCVPACGWRVYDAPGLEALCHRICTPWWVGKEWFQAPWEALRTTIEATLQADAAQLTEGLSLPWEGPLHTFAWERIPV